MIPHAFPQRCSAVAWLCTIVLLPLLIVACKSSDEPEGEGQLPTMSQKLEQAVQEARAGKTFMESSLSGQTMTADDAKAAKGYISQHADSSAYILLMALRKDHPQVYAGISDKTRATVLCDAMKMLTFLNDFGYLDPSESYDGDAAKAILAVGKPALQCLKTLLDNREAAPLFGSEEATMSSMYQYRRADFAYRYIMLILGREPTFLADPAERDKLIVDLQKELEGD